MTSFIQPDRFQYEKEKILGEGLNSIVWRARRFNLSGDLTQAVALKLPKDQTSVPFLRREFETLTQVNSVYCVRVIAWSLFQDAQR